MSDFDEIVAPLRARTTLAGVQTRYPDARRTRMRIGEILLDYVQIRPRDLTIGTRVIVRERKRHVVRHVVELYDARTPDPMGGRYRYRLDDGRWYAAAPNGWIQIAVDG